MATHTVNIDVVDKTIPIGNNRVIPVINQPNPALGYAASANEVAQLLRLANYYVYEAGTDTIINPYNYYDYFPEAGGGGGGGGGGVTPQTVQSMIDASIDSTVSDTSTKAVQNAAITNFVNSSIESSTAEFKGTYDSKVEMDAVTANQNDYAFLCVLNNDGSVNHYERYKWSDTEVSGSHWLFEYNVNNSSFTAEQWAAINSGIKDTDVSALGGHVNNTNNPHGVTKSQVGLSDVDNTSDADKPISTATQTALNTKFDTAGTGLNKNGTTVSHATPEGAAIHAKAFYKFSTDALGHVNGVTEATEAEVNAIDSGITAAKVGQIETNKNNILLNQNSGFLQKNLFAPTKQTDSFDGAVITAGSGGIYTITSTAQTTTSFVFTLGKFTGENGKTYYVSGCPISSSNIALRVGSNYYGEEIGTYIGTGAEVNVTINFTSGFYTDTPLVFKPMICESNDATFVPYTLPNTTITPALKECVDNGVKNLVNVPDITISASGGGYVTVNNNVVLPAGKYVIIANATATSGNLLTSFKDSGGNTIGSLELAMNGGQIGGTITLSAQSSYFNAFANQPTTVTKYMIITEAMYNAGFTDYKPYALSNAELTTNISLITPFDTTPTQNSTKGMTSGALFAEFSKALRKQSTLSTNDDFNSATKNGMYKFNGGPANNPAGTNNAYGILLVITFDNYIMHLCYDFVNGLYFRNEVTDTWSAWTKIN